MLRKDHGLRLVKSSSPGSSKPYDEDLTTAEIKEGSQTRAMNLVQVMAMKLGSG